MICFTRNFEDVMLQRVLSDVSNGCYIDVGASAPVDDSNTFALYLNGWRGVVIEPLPYKHLWQEMRPEDIYISAAVGSHAGQLKLHVYDDAQQISSGIDDIVEHWRHNGLQPTHSMEVPMLTLNEVIAEHLPNRLLHLLSIDVEGMEHKVLQGLDLHTHRPWIIVLEATLPGCPRPAHQEWEPHLLSNGYIFAYFDGVNRFYLAEEKSELLDRFKLPPNVWDGFEMAKHIQLQAQIKNLEEQVVNLQTELLALKGDAVVR